LPLISIIINCFNGEKFLRRAIDSIYMQDFDDWEIIFWDNASTDKSSLIAKSYDKRLKYFSSRTTIPLGEARNKALKASNGKYIAFLDCDDEFLPGKLKDQLHQMEKNNFALIYSGAEIVNEFGTKIRSLRVKNESGFIFGNLLCHYEIIMASVMIRSVILDESGFEFSEDLKYCPDYNLFMKIASSYSIGVISKSLVKYRKMSSSLSTQSIDIASSENRYTLDYIFAKNPELRNRFKKEANKAYDKLYFYDAVAFIYKKNRASSRKIINKIKFRRWQYLVLYLLLFFPFPAKLILKILRR
jgi:glycosyltransferase involved in cell wall biosynthesis